MYPKQGKYYLTLSEIEQKFLFEHFLNKFSFKLVLNTLFGNIRSMLIIIIILYIIINQINFSYISTEETDSVTSANFSECISSVAETVAAQILSTSEGSSETEDPSAAKIPPALLRLLNSLLGKIASNTPHCNKVGFTILPTCLSSPAFHLLFFLLIVV